MDQLIEHGEVRRGRLGIAIQDLTPELGEALGVEAVAGAVVTSVEDGSPSDRAGLKAGDIITDVNGRPVRGSADLRTRIGLLRVGSEAELVVLRDRERLTIRAEVEPVGKGSEVSGALPKLLGADLRDIPSGTPIFGETSGVLVAAVAEGSPASRTGLQAGDVITAVNRKRVGSVDELASALREASGAAALDVVRGGARMFLVLP
jgi:S1-C subfamily serine protease